MTMAARVNPELSDALCSVAECFEIAATMGSATVGITPIAGGPPDLGTFTLGLPLCWAHARALHDGCRLVDFHSGL